MNAPRNPHYLLTALGFAAALAAGVWVNLLTNALPLANAWGGAVVLLGWNNGWLFAAAALVVAQIATLSRWARAKHQRLETIKARLTAIENDQLCRVLGVAVRGIAALRADVHVNARYFERILGGRPTLRKVPEVHVETDQMPDEYGLDTAIIDEDNLVICASYQQRGPIYEHLEEGHLQRYGPRIRHLIDPRQRWVLACPVIAHGSPNADPKGVICFYSTQDVVRYSRDAVQLKNVAVATAAAFAAILDMRRSLQGLGA